MTEVSYADLAVFARDGEGGNPLAVMEFGTIPSNRWQETAVAIGYSETVFVERGEVATVHIYTPARRVPFAGHPLVGAAHALAPDTEIIRYDTGAARVTRRDDATYVTVVSTGTVEVTRAPGFGLSAHVVEMPLPYLVVEAPDVDTVAALDVADVDGLDSVYVWAWEKPGETVRARFFAPGMGVPEDPATGSAAVALVRTLGDETGSIIVHQGEDIGRPSSIEVSWDGDAVTIGGKVRDLGISTVTLA